MFPELSPVDADDAELAGGKARYLQADAAGNLVVPADLAGRFGIVPGATVRVEEWGQQLLLRRPVTQLARVYVEPTTSCPFACRTCMRHVWQEPGGCMSPEVFGRILAGLKDFSPVPALFFGGIGEPLSHPGILDMVRQARQHGARVELITNGLFLNRETIQALVDAELDTLWVSLDGASPASFGDVREAEAFPLILENLRYLRSLRRLRYRRRPRLGIAFVAMKRNLSELPAVFRLGQRLGATRFSVSNVLPHTEELAAEVLFDSSLLEAGRSPLALDLARIDGAAGSLSGFGEGPGRILRENGLQLAGGRGLTRPPDSCPFVERGSISVRWDGKASPCLPLLHTHAAYLGSRRREIREHHVGSVAVAGLRGLWEEPGYLALRRRLAGFDFPPCPLCNGCDWIESNQEDCFGNPPPVCGGCLWAQGYIICP